MSGPGLDSIQSWATEAVRDRDHSAIEAAAALTAAFDHEGHLASHPIFDRVDRLPDTSTLQLIRSDDSPDQLGQVYEHLLEPDRRRAGGSHFTPPTVAADLISLATIDWPVGEATTVFDPAAGCGAFLLAAARAIESGGGSRPQIVSSQLFGSDLDADALAVADAALALWSGGTRAGDHLAPGDALAARAWDRTFDLVVGNPPFLSQLATATARTSEQAEALRQRFGEVAAGYVDGAALFLLVALEVLCRPGRMVMIQPQSTLAATDAIGVRAAVEQAGHLSKVWLGSRDSFGADVEVCALVVDVGVPDDADHVEVLGPDFGSARIKPVAAGGATPSWSFILAAGTGAPVVDLDDATGELGELCTATAGFRDQFYGLAEHTVEQQVGGDLPPLVTVGMIDPARCRWGRGTFRFNRSRWARPVLDVDGLAECDPALAEWVAARLRPKVCVATQTRVIEATVDIEGRWVPATPVISVHCDQRDLWRVAAVLMAPPLTALAMGRHAGAALSSDALRLSSRQVLALPLPADQAMWADAAESLRKAQTAAHGGEATAWKAQMTAFGAQMCDSYGVTDAHVLAWWEERFPPWR